DLSDIKIGKKTPLTLDKFDDFFRLLPERADSERSWTMDFTARREDARRRSAPFKEKAREHEAAALRLRDRAKLIRKDSEEKKKQFEELQSEATRSDIAAREQKARAEAIENAVYDLKAVNPNARDTTDKRTPEELVSFINEKSTEVQTALARLAEMF
ncbi:MAG: hypothetical protein WCD76_12190, partial [Pyrinomonadaceae bacterium]